MKFLVTEKTIKEVTLQGKHLLELPVEAIVTPLAKDLAKELGITFTKLKKSNLNNTQTPKVVYIGSDHTGVEIKSELKKLVSELGFEVKDIGTNTSETIDYPDIALKVGLGLYEGKARFGIMIDGIGTASAIVLNKIPRVRAASPYNEFTAKTSRTHNDANIISLGARSLGIEVIKSITIIFLTTAFEGERHTARLDKVHEIEKRFLKD